MKNLFILAAIFCLFTSHAVRAQTSTKFLASTDSVFMYVHENGQKIFMHPVKKGQTLFSIAKFYGLSVEELTTYNPWYKADKTIEVSDKVLVPVPNRSIMRYQAKGFKAKDYAKLYYVVQKGDNLFNICNRYFDMPVIDVKKRNNLKSETIELGQLLHIGWAHVKGVPAEWRTPASTKTAEAPKGQVAKGGVEKAVASNLVKANWANDAKTVTGYFCLTNDAPKNAIVEITNPANQKMVQASVVGKMPVVKDPAVKVILSEHAAQALGLTEKSNQVSVRYTKQ